MAMADEIWATIAEREQQCVQTIAQLARDDQEIAKAEAVAAQAARTFERTNFWGQQFT